MGSSSPIFGVKVPNIFGECHVSQMFIPQTDSPPWIVLFCNHPSSACRRDMEPRSQQPTRFFWRLLGALKTTGCVQCARWDPSWPTAVGNFTFTIRFPWEFLEISWELFSPPFGENRSKIAFGREKNLTIPPITEEDVSGCTITLAKIWGVPLPFSVSVSDRIGSLKILILEKWRHFEDPQTPLRFIQVQSPETIGGFWIFLVQVQCVHKLQWFAQVLVHLIASAKKSFCLENHPS